MVNPKLIIDSDVRIHAINVRSAAMHVRTVAMSVRCSANSFGLPGALPLVASGSGASAVSSFRMGLRLLGNWKYFSDS